LSIWTSSVPRSAMAASRALTTSSSTSVRSFTRPEGLC
jgi:hypothetical protein